MSSSPDPQDPLATFDPLGFSEAWMRTATAAMANPEGLAEAGTRYVSGLMAASSAATARALGSKVAGPVAPGRRDRRFGDAAWEDNPAFFAMLQAYLLSGRLVSDVLDSADVDAVTEQRMGFLADMVMDALAPTNSFWTNPAARKKAFETGGASVVRGLRNFVDDVTNNEGMPRQLDPDRFTVGEDLATTEGVVVFRNDLMELIQYAPRTETVYATPLLLSPPWINKYYIMDLAPGRSFVEWAVDHGHTVFAISYRNPDATHRDVRLDDYLLERPDRRARRRARHHRRRAGEHRRPVPRRHPDGRAARLSARQGRRAHRVDHAAEHAGGLQPPGPARGLHGQGLGASASRSACRPAATSTRPR